jgi:transcriptional regulator with XRE-family HTH domain
VEIKEKVGKRIKELRNNKYSQEELADRAGLDRTYISGVERGKRNISITNIEKIAKAFGCTLQEFFSSDIFNNNKRK